MTAPLFSIIIPVFNKQKELPLCLRSLKVSELPIEIILVDDGSTDELSAWTAEQIEQQVGTNSQLKLLRHSSNLGTYAARATGIVAATGAYLVFLDADDTLAPHALSTIASKIDQHASDLLLTDWLYCDVTATQSSRVSRSLPAAWSKEPTDALALYCKVTPLNLGIGGKVIKTAVAQKAVAAIGSLARPLTRFEDQLLVLVCATLADKACYIPEPLYHYHHNPDSERDPARVLNNYEQCLFALDRASSVGEELLPQGAISTARYERLQHRLAQLAAINDYAIRNFPLARKSKGLSYLQAVWRGCQSKQSMKPWIALLLLLLSLGIVRK
ncbi:glycosyltransferase family 2 protein [Pseudidiomarina salilacus]|uniref:glycosyltransferase family 2 protein n=1 Tax=Pseudidiomarina salilacus TaxID=3384452 RepID=UPI0039849AF1